MTRSDPLARRNGQIAREKGPDRLGWMTSSELCRYLGINPSTLKRRLRNGTVPPAAGRSVSGWGLWSPEQQTALLRREARLD